MTFEEMLDHALAMLQRRGRMTYRALKLQFGLDDDHLEALTDELRYAHPQVVADNGRGLIWTGDIRPTPTPVPPPAPDQERAPLSYTPAHLTEKILQIAKAVAHPGSLMSASLVIGLVSLRQGGLRRPLSRLERAMGICQEADVLAFFPLVMSALSAAYTLGGRVADAVPLCTQVMERMTAPGMPVFEEVLCRLFLGEAQGLAGHLEEAHTLTERTLVLARERQERGHQAYALRLLGDIAARREPPEGEPAVAHYRQALALADALGMRPLQAHCHRGLGTLYARRGQWEQERTELGAARDLYRAMDMTFWLPQVEAVLAQAEER